MTAPEFKRFNFVATPGYTVGSASVTQVLDPAGEYIRFADFEARIKAARVAALRASGEPVRIVGSCGSACTMLIGLPAACVARTARLGFHGATGRGQFAAIAEAAANGTLAAHYPPAVARLFWARWSRVRGGQIYWITGEQMIGMGVREC